MTVVAIGLPPLRMTVGRQGPVLIHWAFGPSLSQRDARFRHGLVDPVAAAVSQTLAAVVAAIRAGLVRVSSHALAEAEAEADDERVRQAILITVYLPDVQHWTEGFRRRKAPDAGEAE